MDLKVAGSSPVSHPDLSQFNMPLALFWHSADREHLNSLLLGPQDRPTLLAAISGIQSVVVNAKPESLRFANCSLKRMPEFPAPLCRLTPSHAVRDSYFLIVSDIA